MFCYFYGPLRPASLSHQRLPMKYKYSDRKFNVATISYWSLRAFTSHRALRADTLNKKKDSISPRQKVSSYAQRNPLASSRSLLNIAAIGKCELRNHQMLPAIREGTAQKCFHSSSHFRFLLLSLAVSRVMLACIREA